MVNNVSLFGIFLFLIAWISLASAVGQLTAWSVWSACSQTCGGGVMTRSRNCDVINTCSPEPLDDKEVCNYNVCPVDGTWLNWNSWSMCTLSCGGGTQSRTRTCVGPYNGGTPCPGLPSESRSCNTGSCPIDGNWGEWSGFAVCTQTCGGGVETRNRSCDNPVPQNNGRQCIGDANNFRTCNTANCPGSSKVDGNWGPWSLFGSCSTTCNAGTSSRKRSCTNPAPTVDGKYCQGNDTELIACDLGLCPINGNWNWWGNWVSCTQSCNGGFQIRKRYCDNPPPQYGGANCTGSSSGNPFEDVNEQECNKNPCPKIDGTWGEWSDVGSCSRTCGSGMKIRMRQCNSPAPENGGRQCPGGDKDEGEVDTRKVSCNFNPCPVHGNWGSWSNYSDCSKSCGDGVHTRIRTCSNPPPAHGGQDCYGSGTETKPCVGLEECTVDGAWGTWSAYGACSVTCGGGTAERTRQCDNPKPSGKGQPCVGVDKESSMCGNDTCPAVDGNWSKWGQWSTCTVSCAGGKRTRIRGCNSPSPSGGGLPCNGYSTQAQHCNSGPCPEGTLAINGGWTQWTPFSECTVTCGGGMIIRERSCTNPVPSGGGKACDESGHISREKEMIACNKNICPVDGQWSAWTDWSKCSASCNGGKMSRYRKCNNPAPSGNGINCFGAIEFSDTETQTVTCNTINCNAVTTKTPPSTSTISTTQKAAQASSTTSSPVCPAEDAWDTYKWAETPVNFFFYVPCPSGSSGMASRKCIAPNQWRQPDTSMCKSENVVQLQNAANSAQSNGTARGLVLDSFKTTCDASKVSLAGDMLSCKQILHSLVVMDFFGFEKNSVAEKTDFLNRVLDGLNEMMNLTTRDLWQNIVSDEEHDDASAIGELTQDIEVMGQQVAKFLGTHDMPSYCRELSNLEFCVESLTCGTTSYRQPKEPIPATPPPYHTRGGWVPPPLPNVSYVSIPDNVARPEQCGSGSTIPKNYAITIVYNNMLFFLPNLNKGSVIRTSDFIAMPERSVPMDDTFVANSRVVSSSIYVQPIHNNSALDYKQYIPTPIELHFHVNKTGRDPVCVYLDMNNLRVLYNSSGCTPVEVNINYTKCQCNHMTTFTVLMKLGDDGRYDVRDTSPDGMLLFSCIANMMLLGLIIIIYFIVEVYKKDRFFILINMWIALIIAHFMAMAGGYAAVRDMHACKFVTFVIQCTALAAFMWFVIMSIMIYTQLKDPVPLGRKKKIMYFFVGWVTPFLATVFTMALNYDAYGATDVFCWILWIDGAPMGFALPQLMMVVVILVLLVLSERFVKTKMTNSTASIKSLVETVDYSKLQSYIYKLLAFLFIMFLTWIFFALLNNVTVIFFLLDLASIVFVVMVFCIMDSEVREGFKKKRYEWKNKKIKKQKEKEEDKQPEWVKTMRKQREYMRDEEERDIYEKKMFGEDDLFRPKITQHIEPAKPKYVYHAS